MNSKKLTMLIVSSALATAVAGSYALARGEGGGGDSYANSYSADTAPFVSNCPAVHWHFVHTSPTDITGTAFFNDMSSVSKLTGKLDADGKFHGTLTPISGSGLEGTISGERHNDGSVDAEVNAGDCARGHVHLSRPPSGGGKHD